MSTAVLTDRVHITVIRVYTTLGTAMNAIEPIEHTFSENTLFENKPN